MGSREKVCDRAIAWSGNYRDGAFASGVSDDVKSKGTALLQLAKVTNQREKFASIGFKTV